MSNPTKVVQKCVTCGGDLIFNPSKNGLVCKRCGNFQSVTGAVTTEKSFQTLLHSAPTWQKDTTVLRCEHCGAKSVVSKHDLVVKCDYCGASNMVKTEERPGLRPDTIVLFNQSSAEADKLLANWLSKRFFTPSDFKKQLKNRQLKGIYYPAFTFDANVITRYTGTLVQTNSITVTVDGKETTRTQTTRNSIADVDTQSFDDILVLANDNDVPPKVLKALQPFDTNHGQAFQQSYLSGFTVAQASKEAQDCWAEAKLQMEQSIRNKISSRYIGENTTFENLRLDIDFLNITYKYVLLPLYVGHVEYRGTKYPLYVNGQTGKIHGKTPRSFWKILFTCLFGGALAFGFGIVLALLFY